MINLVLYFFLLKYNPALMMGLLSESTIIQHASPIKITTDSEQIVREFLLTVRSGKDPDKAGEFMAEKVLAH